MGQELAQRSLHQRLTNQIAIRIRDDTCVGIAHTARIRQHDEALPSFHQAIELRGIKIVTDPKTFDIDIAKCLGLPISKMCF